MLKVETLILVGLILQTAGSLLLLGGYAPQIVKLHRTLIPTGISILFWTMIGIGCTGILINMIAQDTSLPVIITQSLNAIGAWYTLGLVIYCKKLRKEKLNIHHSIKWFALAIVIVMLHAYQNMPLQQFGYIAQSVATFALLTAYIPQIIHLYRVKDATGISRWLFLVLGSGLLLVTVNMIITGTSKEIIIVEFVNIALILVQYFLTVYYQNKKEKLS